MSRLQECNKRAESAQGDAMKKEWFVTLPSGRKRWFLSEYEAMRYAFEKGIDKYSRSWKARIVYREPWSVIKVTNSE